MEDDYRFFVLQMVLKFESHLTVWNSDFVAVDYFRIYSHYQGYGVGVFKVLISNQSSTITIKVFMTVSWRGGNDREAVSRETLVPIGTDRGQGKCNPGIQLTF